MQLRLGEEYLRQFGNIAKQSTTLVIPSELSDLASIVATATSIVRKGLSDQKGRAGTS